MTIKISHVTDTLEPTSETLSIDASGALRLPVGDESERPGTPASGQIRFSTEGGENILEFYNGTMWVDLATGAGVAEPANQIVYGTGTGVDSDPDFLYINTTGAFYVNSTNGTSGSVSSTTPGIVGVFGVNGTGVTGGGVTIQAGDGGTTNNGGVVTISGGPGGSTSGAGGAVTVQGGLPVDGNGGAVTIAGRNGVGTDRNGGNVSITAGTATGTGTNGIVTLTGGNGDSFQVGASIIASSGTFFRINTNSNERLEITSTGVWEVQGSAGAAGNLFVSGGTGGPPSWSNTTSGAFTFAGGLTVDTVDMTLSGGATITGVPTPTANDEVTNKEYVDSVAAGLDPKASSRVATLITIGRVRSGQDETDYDGTVDNGTFAGGTGYSASDVLTGSDGTIVTVVSETSGVVDAFTVTTGGTTNVPGTVITFTGGSGNDDFTLTPDANNLNGQYAITPNNGQLTIRNDNSTYFPNAGAPVVIDSVGLLVGNRVLVKNQANPDQNGIYVVTNAGIEGTTDAVLTRASDQDGTPSNEVSGGNFTFVEAGSQAGTGWVVVWDGVITLNTDPVNWTQFSDAGASSLQLYKENPVSPTAPVATGNNAVAIGSGATASGLNAIAVGANVTASGVNSSAFGTEAVSNLYGGQAFSSGGGFATVGDSQTRIFTLAVQTADDALNLMSIGESGFYMVIPANTTWFFSVRVVARQASGASARAAWMFEGVIDRNNTNVTSFVGTPAETVFAQDDPTWTATVIANDTDERLDVQVQGDASEMVLWTAFVRIIEVAGLDAPPGP